MTRRGLAFAAVALVALTACSAAAAHGGGGALGFRSSVTGLSPSAAGIVVTVQDSDDRLELRNDSAKPLVILGYEGEPYLLFDDGRVVRNERSPATYLNDDRYGNVELPSKADAKAPPEWSEVAQKETYEWHDHRIHWMSRTLPPKVAAAKDEPHHVFDWKVPATLGGRSLTIAGTLDYEPPPSGRPTYLLGALVVVAVGGAAAVWLRRRRERVSERA